MKKICLISGVLLLHLFSFSQVNILQQAGIKRIQELHFIESGNYYYCVSMQEGTLSNPFYTYWKAAQFRLEKINKISNQIVASTIVYGDTVQTDSLIYYWSQLFVINGGRVHMVYTKAFPQGPGSIIYSERYLQLDTNLNVTVPEKSLGNNRSGVQSLVHQNGKLILSYVDLSPNITVSKYAVLDNIGNIVAEDTFAIKPVFPATTVHHQIAEVNAYPGNKFLISGEGFLGNAGSLRGIYLADSSLNVIDTFELKPYFINLPGISNGSYPRFPNLIALPTGSVIAGGLLSYVDPSQVQWTYTALGKYTASTRFTLNTFKVFGKTDPLDGGHSPLPSIHNLGYNPLDNRVYYADATHKTVGGGCTGTYNYAQVICADTNLQLHWVKYLVFKPDSCGSVSKVSVPYGRAGIVIVGEASPPPPTLDITVKNFAVYIDSSGSALHTLGVTDIEVRDRIKVTPNPFIDLITVNDIEKNLSLVEVWNSVGTKLVSQQGRAAEVHIKLDVPPGVYIVRVLTRDGKISTIKSLKL